MRSPRRAPRRKRFGSAPGNPTGPRTRTARQGGPGNWEGATRNRPGTPMSSARCSPSTGASRKVRWASGSSASSCSTAEKEGAVSLERGKSGSFGVRLVAGKSGPAASPFDAKALGLPTTESSIKSYLAHRYKGVGVKTAARLVDHFGADGLQGPGEGSRARQEGAAASPGRERVDGLGQRFQAPQRGVGQAGRDRTACCEEGPGGTHRNPSSRSARPQGKAGREGRCRGSRVGLPEPASPRRHGPHQWAWRPTRILPPDKASLGLFPWGRRSRRRPDAED